MFHVFSGCIFIWLHRRQAWEKAKIRNVFTLGSASCTSLIINLITTLQLVNAIAHRHNLLLLVAWIFSMGCLPTCDQVDWGSAVLLSVMQWLQGTSIGGQITSSFIFTLKRQDQNEWRFCRSIVIMSCGISDFFLEVCLCAPSAPH